MEKRRKERIERGRERGRREEQRMDRKRKRAEWNYGGRSEV